MRAPGRLRGNSPPQSRHSLPLLVHRWNLHNLPFAPGSILRHVPQIINGINVPWLYIGMLFASFAWHVEDNYLCSISYLHYGSPKIWCV